MAMARNPGAEAEAVSRQTPKARTAEARARSGLLRRQVPDLSFVPLADVTGAPGFWSGKIPGRRFLVFYEDYGGWFEKVLLWPIENVAGDRWVTLSADGNIEVEDLEPGFSPVVAVVACSSAWLAEAGAGAPLELCVLSGEEDGGGDVAKASASGLALRKYTRP